MTYNVFGGTFNLAQSIKMTMLCPMYIHISSLKMRLQY